MVWLKRVIAGVIGAILAVVLVVAAIIRMNWNFGEGSGGVGVFVISLSTLPFIVAALVGFGLGWWWMDKRPR